MLISVKDLTALMNERMELIESNKTAPVPQETILKTNGKLLELLHAGLETLKRISCNKVLVEKYTKSINDIKVI